MGTISHHQLNESSIDGAESRPHEQNDVPSVNVSLAENTLHTSVNSVSAAPGDSSGEQPAEIASSTPPLALPAPEEVSRPTDEQIIAQENSIRSAECPYSKDIHPRSAVHMSCICALGARILRVHTHHMSF